MMVHLSKLCVTGLFRNLILIFLLSFMLPGFAHAQVAELNPNDPNGYEIDFNADSTASGTIPNVGTGGGPGGWNTAQFDFDFSVGGAATWAGGVEFQLQGGVQQLWNQPVNTDFPGGDVGNYTMRWTRGVGGLTFYHGGLDNDDTVQIRAFYNNAPVALLDSYFSDFSGAVFLESNDGTTAVLVGPAGGSGNERAREYRVTFPDTVLVDRIEYVVGKGDARAGNVTLAYYLFDWLPLTIDAQDDVGPRVPNNTATIGVLDVLDDNGNGVDTLDDPNTAGIDAATSATVTVTPVGAPPSGITLNTDGTIDVASGTANGTYSIPYQICEIANPTNCATATATLVVADPDPVFNGGSGPVSSCTATTLTTTALLSDDGGSYDGGNIVSYADAAGSGVAITFSKLSGSDAAGGSSAPFYAAAFPDPVRGIWLGSDDQFGSKFVGTGLDTESYRIDFSPAITQATLDFTALNFNVDGDERIEITAINGAPATSATSFQFTASGDVVFNTATGRIEGGASYTAAGTDGGRLVVDNSGGISSISFDRIEFDNTLSSKPAPDRNRTNGIVLGPFSFCPPQVDPVAQNDVVTGLPTSTPATLNPLADNGNGPDSDADGTIDATSVVFTGTGAPTGSTVSLDGKTLTVPDEGVWTIAASGEVTFTPAAGFTANPTPATYTVDDNNGNTSNEATITLEFDPPVIIAENDDFTTGPVNGTIGGSPGNVLTNDTLDANPIDPDLTTILVNGDGGLTGVTIDDDGTLNVPPGTPAGTYTVSYQLCEDANADTSTNPATGNCDTATVEVQVDAPVIDAVDDDFTSTPVTGFDGGVAGNVLGNDALNTNPVDPALTTILVNADGGLTGVTIDDDGDVDVPAGTPAGTYTVTYQLCEDLNADTSTNPATGNCDIATATVVVDEPQILAVDNDFSAFPVNGFAGGDTANVLSNDSFNNDPLALDGSGVPTDVTLIPGTLPVSPATGGLTMNADGTITVAPGTTAGTYSFPYTISDNLNPASVSTAVATVVVAPADVDAVPEPTAIIPPNTAATAMNVLTSDTINGVTATPTNVIITEVGITYFVDGAALPGAPANGGVTLDTATGDIDVDGASQGFRAVVEYQICDAANPTNCDTATETVIVPPLSLEALPETFPPISGLAGGTLADTVITSDIAGDGTGTTFPVNLTSGDIYEVSIAEVAIVNKDTGQASTNVSLNTTNGEVSIAPNTPAGEYGVTYEICLQQSGPPQICRQLEELVNVTAAPIVATPDSATGIDGNAGADDVLTVYENDTLNGVAITAAQVAASDVTLSVITPAVPQDSAPVPVLDPTDGTVDVPAGTPAGSYDIVYEVCEALNTYTSPTPGNSNCAVTIATVVVDLPPIVAVDDDFSATPVDGVTGGAVGSIFDPASDDTLDGVALTAADITSGAISLLQASTPTPINGGPVPTLDLANGDVAVPAGTPAGTYSFDYTICDVVNTFGAEVNCDTATVTVEVAAPPIVATPDSVSGIDGSSGEDDALSVLGNDTFNGSPIAVADVTAGDITLAVTTPATSIGGAPVPVLDPTDGTVDVPAGTPEGTYVITYEICDALNTFGTQDNCATTTATVEVLPDPPVAQNDVVSGLPTATPATLNPLIDNGNGADADPDGTLVPASVVFTGTGAPAGSTVSPDGKTLTVPDQGVWTIAASGDVTFAPETGFTANPTPAAYTVDDNDGNTSNEATITLEFVAQPPVAEDDLITGLPTNTPAVVDPFADNGNGPDADPDGSLDPASVVFTGTGSPTGSSVSPDGKTLTVPDEGVWTIAPSGAVTFTAEAGFTADPAPATYTVDDNDGNTSNEATITLDFDAEDPVAQDDVVTGLPTNTPATLDPFADNGNGPDADPDGALDPASVVFTGIGAPVDATVSADGKTLTVPDEGVWTIVPSGEVTFTPADGFTNDPTPAAYTVDDNDGNTSNEATITLDFDAQPPVAQDDVVTGLPTNTPATLDPLADNGSGVDADADGAVDPTSVIFTDTGAPAGSTVSADGKTLTVPDEGVWTIATSGEVTFTPETGFTADPTPAVYTVDDNDGNTSNEATITLDFDTQDPVAQDDSVTGLPTNTPATLDPFADNGSGVDADPDGTLDVTSVALTDPAATDTNGDGFPDTLVVADQGTWTVDPTDGSVTFTPEDGFTADPAPVNYTVNDNDGNTSNEATITLDFDQAAPDAVDDSVPGVPGVPTVVDVLGNDTDPDNDIDPTTVAFTDPAATDSDGDGDADTLIVPGQGVWTVDPDTGAVTFTAEPAFVGDPTPVTYTVTDATGLTSDPATITIDYPVTGTGISGIAFLDNDASDTFDPTVDELLSGVIVELTDPDGNVIASGVTDADGFYELTNFAVGQDFTLSFIDPDTSEVLATVEDLDFVVGTVLEDVDVAVRPLVPSGAVEIAKNALIRDVVIGGSAPFEIIVTNLTDGPVGPITVRDNLPVGLVYTPESATVGGVSTEPVVEGRTLTFNDIVLPPNGTVTVTLLTRVTTDAPNGDITNRALVIDPETGLAATSEAEASVRRRPEAVFNCSDVIGKVFDDRNMDGYQNPPANAPVVSSRGPIVDFDAPLSGKFGGAVIEPEITGEPGLPNVRVVTPTGTIITTDQYGRFSVPCAELPGAIGTNFALKVDTNSLPTGYRLTTDNPLVMRLTAGSFAEMNFGASIGRVVGIDLTAAAYQGRTAEPVDRLEQGVLGLLEQVRDTPSVIRLSYFANGEAPDTIDARLDAVEALINDRWATIGRYRLVIERTTKQLQ